MRSRGEVAGSAAGAGRGRLPYRPWGCGSAASWPSGGDDQLPRARSASAPCRARSRRRRRFGLSGRGIRRCQGGGRVTRIDSPGIQPGRVGWEQFLEDEAVCAQDPALPVQPGVPTVPAGPMQALFDDLERHPSPGRPSRCPPGCGRVRIRTPCWRPCRRRWVRWAAPGSRCAAWITALHVVHRPVPELGHERAHALAASGGRR
jgi:hypothetical protein